MQIRRLILLLVMVLVACTHSSGNIKIIDYSQNLVLGKTTKWDIKRDLGKPTTAEISSSGYEYWEYKYHWDRITPMAVVPGATRIDSLKSKVAKVKNYRLVLEFNDKGVLNDYRATVPTSEPK